MAKKLKIKDYLRDISNSNEETASAIRENNRLLIEQTEIEQKKLKYEIETKDRVDISLKRYEEMKRMIEILETQNEKYRNIFERMGVEEWANDIEPSTIQVATIKDPIRLSTRVHIQFESKRNDYF